jgi:hypothetical protein
MIRTWDPQIRNLVLYPTELPGQSKLVVCFALKIGIKKFHVSIRR